MFHVPANGILDAPAVPDDADVVLVTEGEDPLVGRFNSAGAEPSM
jgi:hypothetical protein